MSNYDPFGGGNKSEKYNSYDNYSESSNNNSKKTKSLITWLIILAIIGGIIYYFFFNNATATFNVKNTEGKSISANIVISKSEDMIGKTEKITSTDSITLKKGKYYYSVQNKDYSSKKGSFTLKSNIEVDVDPLEKNIKLKLIDLTASPQAFVGQSLKFNIEVENTSPTEDYNIDNFVFGGIIKDINNFNITDIEDNILDKSYFKIPSQTKQTIYFDFILPQTTKIGDKQTIEVRIRYKLDKKSTTINVIKEPIITITPENINTTLTSGETQTFKIKINNSKNKVTINDIIISLDINSEINENVNDWFNYPVNQILVNSQETNEQILTLTIPASAKADNIIGNLYVTSSTAPSLDKNIPIELEIKEPIISFIPTISNKTVNLIYDINTNTLSEEYRTLTLDNKSKVNIKVVSYSIENGTDTNDCSNFIYISDSYSNITVLPGTKQEAIINIKAKDTNNLANLINTSRLCPIKINYLHPYREGEYLSSLENLTIYFK